jgi:hypothetical protein
VRATFPAVVIGFLLATAPAAPASPAADAAKRKPKRGPINARATLDQSRAVSATVTAATGGALSVKAAKGTTMTITFPPNAVLEDTVVTAVPVKKLAGRFTTRGLLAGVQLSPDGLQLVQPATVRFTRRGKAKKGTRLVFVGSKADGKDLYRLPPPVRVRGKGSKARVVPTGAPTVSILHFSTVEGFDWSTATVDQINQVARPALGLARMSDEISALLSQKPPATVAEVLEVMERYRKTLIEPILSAAVSKLQTCSLANIRYAKIAMQAANGFNRQIELIGGTALNVYPTYTSLLRATGLCMVTLCPQLGDPRMGPYMLGIARQLSLLGDDYSPAYFQALFEAMKRCSTYEVRIDARIDFEEPGRAQYSMRVAGKVKVEPAIEGTAPPRRAPLEYKSTSGQENGNSCFVTTISGTKPGVFELTDATLSDFDPDKPSADRVKSLTITMPVRPLETYHASPTGEPNCGSPNPDFDQPLWALLFEAKHAGLKFEGARFLPGDPPVFARAVYSPDTIDLGGGSVSENTQIELVHTPGDPVQLPEPVAAG